jgi:hypothetical protein
MSGAATLVKLSMLGDYSQTHFGAMEDHTTGTLVFISAH